MGKSTRQSEALASSMSSPKALLCNAMKEASFQPVGRGPAEELQDEFVQDNSPRLLIVGEEDESITIDATQEPQIAVQDKVDRTRSTDQKFTNTIFALMRQNMKTLKTVLLGKVRFHPGGATASIILALAEENASKRENTFVDFVKKTVRSDMVSSRLTSNAEEARKDTFVCKNVSGRMSECADPPERLISPVAVFVWN